MKTDFIPLDYDYFDFRGKNYARIIGRNSKNQKICLIDSCPIYLWAILKENIAERKIQRIVEKIQKIQIPLKNRITRVEKIEIHEKSFLGKKVTALKIFATNYKDLHDIASQLKIPEIEKRRGYDLGFVTHYIIEKKLTPLNWYEIEGEVLSNSLEFGGIDSALNTDLTIFVKNISNTPDKKFTPCVLAYDLETDEIKIGEGEILMFSLVSNNGIKKVFTWKKSPGKKIQNVEYVKDEAELIETFVSQIKKINPDFLVGYFSDGFDLPYLKARAEKHKIKLDIGIEGSEPRFHRSGLGGITGKISGITHIDLLKFIRTAYSQYMQSETLSLNEVAKEFLQDEKKKFQIQHSTTLKKEDWKNYYEYNLHDSVLTLGLFEKMWPDLVGFSKVMQEPIFEISRNGMSKNVESYLIHNLERFNEIPEKRPTHNEIADRRQREKYEGAFVFEPTPGLYNKIGMFDFTSYWPSIIVSFNLSKSTLLEKEEKESTKVKLKNKEVIFSKKPGFFPQMLKEIIEKRKLFKKELKEKPDVMKKSRSNAYKLLANASYGYMGFFGARYYCPEASAAATSISRDFIKKTISEIDKEGYKTIYSDTDSIAFSMNNKSEKQTLEFLKKINSKLPGIMELELEDFYSRGLWVTTRAGKIGAKKKYALIDKKNKLKIRGFETVRRDWCRLARDVQNKVLKEILENGNEKKSLEYLKEIVKKLKSRQISREELIIKTQLKKSLSEYKSISPHVVAAQKMKEQEIPISEGNLVEYYIAEIPPGTKSKLVREKVKLPNEPGKYNIEYYLERQILPAVENIFQVFNINTSEIIKGKRQMTLGEF